MYKNQQILLDESDYIGKRKKCFKVEFFINYICYSNNFKYICKQSYKI